jgi:hypothetical protein
MAIGCGSLRRRRGDRLAGLPDAVGLALSVAYPRTAPRSTHDSTGRRRSCTLRGARSRGHGPCRRPAQCPVRGGARTSLADGRACARRHQRHPAGGGGGVGGAVVPGLPAATHDDGRSLFPVGGYRRHDQPVRTRSAAQQPPARRRASPCAGPRVGARRRVCRRVGCEFRGVDGRRAGRRAAGVRRMARRRAAPVRRVVGNRPHGAAGSHGRRAAQRPACHCRAGVGAVASPAGVGLGGVLRVPISSSSARPGHVRGR